MVGGTSWLWADPNAAELSRCALCGRGRPDVACECLCCIPGRRAAWFFSVIPNSSISLSKVVIQRVPMSQHLQHMLGDHKTIPSDRGIFLSETWRLAPSICKFTSEVFYEGRLSAHAGLERQVLVGTAPFEGAGLWVDPVQHEGNQNSSIEEVDEVDRIVASLLRPGCAMDRQQGHSTSDDGR